MPDIHAAMRLTPPRPNIAPLNALRAFEAAARHGSFLRAAEELSVTPGAIAQQIKKLEEWAGVRLFERLQHGVELTALGQRLLPQLEQSFQTLGLVSQTLRHGADRPEVRIAALPAIAQLWLSPMLSALRTTIAEVDLAIHALDVPPALGRGEFDLAIYPAAMFANDTAQTIPLAENAMTPVAAPSVADAIDDLEDLTTATLIHDLAWKDDWETWLKTHPVPGLATGRGPTHSLYSIALERCVEGDGVLIGHTALIRRQLQEGTLRRVFPGRDVSGQAICMQKPRQDIIEPRVAKVIGAISSSAQCPPNP